MSKNREIAEQFAAKCAELGWTFHVKGGSVVCIKKSIEPNNNDAFVKADMEYYSILSIVPTSSAGSMWGTDGGGIGALSAINSGRFVMNKSGCNKMVLKQLAKLEK